MPSSNHEALCFFLNQMGSRVPDDGSGSATTQRQHLSAFNKIVRGSGEQLDEHYWFPSLALFKSTQAAGGSTASERMEKYDFSAANEGEKKSGTAAWPKETALRNLSSPIRYRGSELHRAPSEMANRALDSFAFLVAANLRQFFRIQLRRHARGGLGACDAKARDIASFFLDGTAAAGAGASEKQEGGKPIDIMAASTSFHLEQREDSGSKLGAAGPQLITFYMNVELCVLGCKTSIPINTVGELKASFDAADSNQITGATVTLATNQLLLSMRTQARLVVLKAVAKKGFPVIHTDAPTIIPQATSEVQRIDDKAGGAGEKMKKLALCASLELASVINDTSPLSSQCRRAKQEDTHQKRGSAAKRRLSAAMGGAGALFMLPGSKRPMMSAPSHKIAGGKNHHPLPQLGQVAPGMIGMSPPRLVHQA